MSRSDRRPALPALSPSLARINPHVSAPRARRPRKPVLPVTASVEEVIIADVIERVGVTLHGLDLPSLANGRDWRARHRATKRARHAVYEHVHPLLGTMVPTGALAPLTPPPGPLDVTITRVAPRRLDDDNAVASAKAVRDAVALWVGVDDRHEDVRYEVRQERGPAAVRIVVARRTL